MYEIINLSGIKITHADIVAWPRLGPGLVSSDMSWNSESGLDPVRSLGLSNDLGGPKPGPAVYRGPSNFHTVVSIDSLKNF